MNESDIPDIPSEIYPLIIELDDGWLVEWFTGECPGEGEA